MNCVFAQTLCMEPGPNLSNFARLVFQCFRDLQRATPHLNLNLNLNLNMNLNLNVL